MASPVSPPDSEFHNVVACLGGERTALERRAIPAPAADEMLLKLRVVGFCGTDLFKLTTDSVTEGTVLGHEIVGEVVRLGDAVGGFRAGDRVAVPHHVSCGTCRLCRSGNETMCDTFRENLMEPGGFADHVLIKSRATAQAAQKVPDGISDEAAVFLEPAACVLRGITRSGLADGGSAAILGGGSMGLLHLLVIKAAMPNVSVMLIDPVPERREIASSLGADATVEPGTDAVAAASSLAAGHGVDAVFDTVGGAALLKSALALCRQGGTVVLFAHAPDGQPADFDLNDLFKFEKRVIGSYSGALAEQSAVFDLIRNGALNPTPLVTHTMPLDDFEHGFRLAKNRQALKVLFTPSRRAAAP